MTWNASSQDVTSQLVISFPRREISPKRHSIEIIVYGEFYFLLSFVELFTILVLNGLIWTAFIQEVISASIISCSFPIIFLFQKTKKAVCISVRERKGETATSYLPGDRVNEIRIDKRISCLAYLIRKGCVEKLLFLSSILHTPYISS